MTVLVLAGTGEARALLSRCAGLPVVASLAGATRAPLAQGVETIRGGFGGAEGFAAFLRDQRVRAVIDATHPFAARITARTAQICAELGVPLLRLTRPEWTPQKGDRWTMVPDAAAACAVVPPGATVFLATGRQSLPDFAALTSARILCRQIDPPDTPFPFQNGTYVIGRPPFSVEHEVQLFQNHNVTHLVTKNAGGAASATKLTAARHLRLPVIMIDRPPSPDIPTTHSIEDAHDWLCSYL